MKTASSGYSENLSQKHKQINICLPGIDKILEHFQGERTQRWMTLENKRGLCSSSTPVLNTQLALSLSFPVTLSWVGGLRESRFHLQPHWQEQPTLTSSESAYLINVSLAIFVIFTFMQFGRSLALRSP